MPNQCFLQLAIPIINYQPHSSWYSTVLLSSHQASHTHVQSTNRKSPSIANYYTMVCIKSLACATFLAASASAFLLPSLDELAEAFIPLDAAHSEGDVISTFPNPNEKPIPGNAPIVQCEAINPQILDLQEVIIDPSPPVKGQNLTFSATGYLSKDIEDGAYVEVDVRFGFIRLIHQTYDLCEQVGNVDLECPIKKGKQVITKEVEIPAEVPPGKYTVNARAFDKNDVLITCLTATVEFPAGEAES